MSELHFNYQLASRAGYKSNICEIGNEVYDQLAYWNKENFPDIEITRPGIDTDLNLLHTKAILTVNGYLYPTVYSGNRLYIPNATKSMLKSKTNQIGIISFNKLSSPIIKHKIEAINITPETNFSLYEKLIITMDTDINSPILSLCGYIILEDPEVFYRVSPNAFILRLDRLNYINKLYELQRYRDIFTELNIPVSVNNPSMIDYTIARSDITITKFLSSFNSFIIDLPVTNLHLNKIYLEHSNIPSTFRTEIEPLFPMIVGSGKLAEYGKTKSLENKYTVNTLDAYYNNHLFSFLPYTNISVINDHRVVGNTYRLSEAYFLDLYTVVP
ncbi:MAG: Virion structural protein [uncultured bacterium]|nr:MAG: Virion structural protein [uncultured bacterium]